MNPTYLLCTFIEHEKRVSIWAGDKKVADVPLLENGGDGGCEAVVEQAIDAIRKRFDYSDVIAEHERENQEILVRDHEAWT